MPGGDALAGAPQPAGDLEFSIEQQEGEQMVVVKEAKAKAVKGERRARSQGVLCVWEEGEGGARGTHARARVRTPSPTQPTNQPTTCTHPPTLRRLSGAPHPAAG